MKRLWISALVFVALIATAPWLFIGKESSATTSPPHWAVYAIGATLVFAILVSWALGRFWRLFKGDERDGGDDGR